MKVATKDGLVELGDPNLNPLVWPTCTNCKAPYVLRRCYSMSQGMRWFWQNDCAKPRSICKSATAVMYDCEGELPPTGRHEQ